MLVITASPPTNTVLAFVRAMTLRSEHFLCGQHTDGAHSLFVARQLLSDDAPASDGFVELLNLAEHSTTMAIHHDVPGRELVGVSQIDEGTVEILQSRAGLAQSEK